MAHRPRAAAPALAAALLLPLTGAPSTPPAPVRAAAAVPLPPVVAGRLTVTEPVVRTVDGRWVAHAHVVNGTNGWRAAIAVTATFLDAAGRALGAHTSLAQQNRLAPSERGHVRLVAVPPPGTARAVLSVRSLPLAARAAPAVRLVEDAPYQVRGGATRYVGRLTSATAVTGVHVYVLRLDAAGRLLDFGHDVLPAVAPGAGERYLIEVPPRDGVAAVRLAWSVD